MNLTEFCETRLLPVVLAFGCGVLAMDWAQAARIDEAYSVAHRAVAVAEKFREACTPWPPEELPVEELARLEETRR
ncbi:hypothetical protein LLG90_13555 [Aromatoleum toluclasticum]|uniref:hypothetical protein n=1 Tax=Aromatoleum toluclasticum TaxID=92003 RepID=UPI001D19250F|nr:hypothetical protein [Aromatoleum toluclasticum]MCC4116381.1 hypothetical protein [Aromatoleum toluclasticum]